MNDELDKLLKSARVPERSAGYWEHFPRRVVARLEDAPAARRTWWWALAVASACLVAGLILWPRSQTVAPTDYAALYRQVAGMFPGQLQAIVTDESGIHLVLAETPDVPRSQPLFVRLCEPTSCRSVITFSGQRVRLDGQTIEVLADGRGGIHIIGEKTIVQPTEARAL